MSVAISDIISHMDRYIGDASTDRVSTADRYQYITEAVTWLQEELENDHQISTYTLNHLDTIYRYEVTTALADLLVGADLKQRLTKNTPPFTHRSARELNIDIANGSTENAWSIEREDAKWYLLVNFMTNEPATLIDGFESITNWEIDGDAENITLDSNEFIHGGASLNFDIDVSDDVSDRASVKNDDFVLDWSDFEDLGTIILEVYIPDVTETSSVGLRWGDTASTYWTRTVTTDVDGNALSNGWNTVAFEWSAASKVSTPTTAITFIQIDINYTNSQADDTDYRVDYMRIAKDTNLTFSYLSWYVGTDTGGTDILEFSATTDVPYFSGKYDQYKYAVAHKSAALALSALRLSEESEEQNVFAERSLSRKRNIFPSIATPEQKAFKVGQVSFNRRGK